MRFVSVMLMALVCFSCVAEDHEKTLCAPSVNVTVVTDKTFNDEIINVKDTVVMVDFCADWCGPCRRGARPFNDFADKYVGKVKLVRLTDNYDSIFGKYDVHAIPCIIFFKNGAEIDRTYGFHDKDELKAKFEEFTKTKLPDDSDNKTPETPEVPKPEVPKEAAPVAETKKENVMITEETPVIAPAIVRIADNEHLCAPSKNVRVTTNHSYEVDTKASGYVLVQYAEDWCDLCRDAAPIVNEFADKQVGNVKVVRVTYTQCPRASADCTVIPTIILFKDGHEVARQSGALKNLDALQEFFDKSKEVKTADNK